MALAPGLLSLHTGLDTAVTAAESVIAPCEHTGSLLEQALAPYIWAQRCRRWVARAVRILDRGMSLKLLYKGQLASRASAVETAGVARVVGSRLA